MDRDDACDWHLLYTKALAEIERLQAAITKRDYDIFAMHEQNVGLSAEIERLRAALRPFADALNEAERDYPDDKKLHCQWTVQLADFERACRALDGEKG